MKKGLLALLVMIGMAATTQAQSLMIVNYDMETMVNSNSVQDYSSHVEIKNTTTSSLNVKVRRVVFDGNLCAFDSTYFCWDFCYTPEVSNSVGTMPIGPGATDDISFSGHVYSSDQGASCSDSIRYVFYVDGNPNDSASVTLVSPFNCTPESNPINKLIG